MFDLIVIALCLIVPIIVIVQLGYLVGGVNKLVRMKEDDRFRERQKEILEEKHREEAEGVLR